MWARIHHGTVAELTDIDPAGRFHPSLQWEMADATIQVGDLYDGQTYSRPVEALEGLAGRQRSAIATALAAELATGMSYTMPDGTADVVQLQAVDRQNLMGLAIEARDLVATGETGAVQEFRAQSNTRYPMTPDEVIAMTDQAMAHYKQLLEHSWDRKDTIAAALADETLTDDEKRAAIEAVTW